MKREQLEKARALREKEGLTFDEAAAKLGVSVQALKSADWRDRNHERSLAQVRAYKARNKAKLAEYEKAYAEHQRVKCPDCGVERPTRRPHQRAKVLEGKTLCPNCIEQRRQRIVKYWREGLALAEIAERLGWTGNHVGVEINLMRDGGYDLPYRRASRKPKYPELARG